jgi:hypothetical protein
MESTEEETRTGYRMKIMELQNRYPELHIPFNLETDDLLTIKVGYQILSRRLMDKKNKSLERNILAKITMFIEACYSKIDSSDMDGFAFYMLKQDPLHVTLICGGHINVLLQMNRPELQEYQKDLIKFRDEILPMLNR